MLFNSEMKTSDIAILRAVRGADDDWESRSNPVTPVSHAFPAPSSATAVALSPAVPPSTVE